MILISVLLAFPIHFLIQRDVKGFPFCKRIKGKDYFPKEARYISSVCDGISYPLQN